MKIKKYNEELTSALQTEIEQDKNIIFHCFRKMTSVRYEDLFIDESQMADGAKGIMCMLHPEFQQEDLKIKVFTDGISNKLVGCYHKDDPGWDNMVLVRVYGQKTELLVDRELECKNFQILHAAGLSRPLYMRFKNGIAYGFSPGSCIDRDTVKDPHIASLIAREMVKMHNIDVNKLPIPDSVKKVDRSPGLFRVVRDYLGHLPDSFEDAQQNARYTKEVMNKTEIANITDHMEQELNKMNPSVAFTHNDLLLNNIVYNKKQDSICFIDFEYGQFSYTAYDIADHFCEYAGVDDVDYSLYPNKDYQLTWLRKYLEFDCEARGKSASDISDKDVGVLYVQVNKFALMSHVMWGVWALMQAHFSTIDFDFLGYAILRFNEYKARKEEFMSLKIPE